MYTPEEIEDLFKKHNEKWWDFDNVVNKRSKKPDLHAFLLLCELAPDNNNIIGGADHGVIYLNVELDQLEDITEDQIIELCSCGVNVYDGYLQMFV